jgi:hypothetical protein
MKRLWTTICMTSVLAVTSVTAHAEIRLIARLKTSGTSSDKSGLKEKLEDGTSLSQLGGWSAIAASDVADEYWLLPDRGPKDGAVSYPTRVHKIRLKFDIQKEATIQFELLETLMLKSSEGKALIGLSSAFSGPDASTNLRFDPEGIRALSKDRIVISDEYGPSVVVFDTTSGKAVKWFNIPNHFVPKHLSGDADQEMAENQSGRQANGGFEGLALQSDQQTLLAFAQKPLLQDATQGEDGKLVGSMCRVVEFSQTGKSQREFLYPLQSGSTAVSEILGLGNSQALVLERDSAAGVDSKCKGVYWIDYSKATDSQSISSVAPSKFTADVKQAVKKPFIEFLDAKFGLAGEMLPAKPEGLTFGPVLPDGSRTLIISVDNDFDSTKESELWIFSFTTDDLPTP